MLFGLKPLSVDSEQVLNFLASKTFADTSVGRSFQQLNSPSSQRLARLLSRLKDSCETFGERDDFIPITVESAIDRMLGARWQTASTDRWLLFPLFQLANLATFAGAVLGPDARSGYDFGVLHIMNEQFPSPFTSAFGERDDGSLEKGFSRLLDGTFAVGLEIRTQFAIWLLSERRSERNFDPDIILNRVFCVGNDGDDTQFLGFPAEGLSISDRVLPKEFEPAVSQRIQELREHFSEHIDYSVDIASLTAAFPWEHFLAQTISWVQARAAELSQQIDDRGGLSIIQQRLQEEVNRQQIPKPNGVLEHQRARESPARQPASPKDTLPIPHVARSAVKLGKAKHARRSIGDEAKRLMELKAQMASAPVVTKVVGSARAVLEGGLKRSPLLAGHTEAPPTSTLEALLRDKSINKEVVAKAYTTVEKQARQSNKENIDIRSRSKTFVDRQAGAEKVSFDDESQEVLAESTWQNISLRKRSREENDSDNDDEDDDDFEVTAPSAANKRRKELHNVTGLRRPPGRPRSKHPRTEVPESVPSMQGADDDFGLNPDNEQAAIDQQLANGVEGSSPIRPSHYAPPSAQRERSTPTSSHPTTTNNTIPPSSAPAASSLPQSSRLPPTSTNRELPYVRQVAREKVMRALPSKVQSRSAYTLAQEERIIDLIEQHGISYRLILEMDREHPDGPLLGGRSQVQIKDKAQELKFQYLK